MILSPKKAIGMSLPIRLGTDGYFATNSDTISQVSDNIKNILLTKPGERRFNNSFGSSLYNILFDNLNTDVNSEIISDSIQRDINKYMTGVSIRDIKLSTETINNANNSIFINITFEYNSTIGDVNFNIETSNL